MPTRTTVDHPTWCSAPHCWTDELGEVEHRSAPVSYRTDADDAEIVVQRRQHAQAATSGYRVTVTHLDLDEQVSFELSNGDAAMLYAVFGMLRDAASSRR